METRRISGKDVGTRFFRSCSCDLWSWTEGFISQCSHAGLVYRWQMSVCVELQLFQESVMSSWGAGWCILWVLAWLHTPMETYFSPLAGFWLLLFFCCLVNAEHSLAWGIAGQAGCSTGMVQIFLGWRSRCVGIMVFRSPHSFDLQTAPQIMTVFLISTSSRCFHLCTKPHLSSPPHFVPRRGVDLGYCKKKVLLARRACVRGRPLGQHTLLIGGNCLNCLKKPILTSLPPASTTLPQRLNLSPQMCFVLCIHHLCVPILIDTNMGVC